MESCVASARLGNKERGTHVHTLAGPLIASSLLISSFFFFFSFDPVVVDDRTRRPPSCSASAR